MEQTTLAPENDSLLSLNPDQIVQDTEQQDAEQLNFVQLIICKAAEKLLAGASRLANAIEPESHRRVRELTLQLAENDDSRTSNALRELRDLGLSARASAPWVKKLLLGDPSAEIRSRALLTLLKTSTRPSKDIIRACTDENRNIRLRLAHYFAYEWLNGDAEFTYFLRSLENASFSERLSEALDLLKDSAHRNRLGLRTRRDIEYVLFPEANEGENEEKLLVYFLKDPDPEIRKLATVALGIVPWESERVNSALSRILYDNDLSLREWALESLESRNVSLYILLRSIANDEKAPSNIRNWALGHLVRDHGNKALAFFVTLQKNDSTPPEVQLAAVGAIEKLTNKS